MARFATLFVLSFAIVHRGGAQEKNATEATPAGVPGKFVDITERAEINFQYQASHTSRKYLLETMGAGVALFDYDNDGLLDIFLVNGAPLSDRTPKGTIPEKTGSKYWNRLYHQKADGTFEDVTMKAGLQGTGYGMGVAVGDYDNDGFHYQLARLYKETHQTEKAQTEFQRTEELQNRAARSRPSDPPQP